MAAESRKARDLALLDAIDAVPRESFEATRLWRVVRDGRDPTLGSPSQSRWCNGEFDVLYTSFDRDGAIAEIHALLSEQPVFPSKMIWRCYELEVRPEKVLRLADMSALEKLGVDISAYRERRYDRTRSIADAAFFLGFDAVAAPSARWNCQNLVLFTDRFAPDDIRLTSDRGVLIDWAAWRRQHQVKR
jgi:hypothetical protein